MAAVPFNADRDDLAAEVAAVVGEAVRVVTDPRALNPPCVLIGVPLLEISQARTVRVLTPIHVVTPPPATDDQVRWMLDQLGAIVGGIFPLVESRFGPYDTSERVLPAHTAIVDRTTRVCL